MGFQKIYVKRSGGFAGILRKFVLEEKDIPADEADMLFQKLLRVHKESKENLKKDTDLPDHFQYSLQVESSEEIQELNFSESASDPTVREIISIIGKYAKPVLP